MLLDKARHLATVIATTADDIAPAYSAVSAELAGATREELDAAAAAIFAVDTTDVMREINLYVVTGAMVEYGGDPTIGWPHFFGRLRAVTADLARTATPDTNLDAGVFRYLVMAAMARLARRVDLRNEARADKDFVANVATLQATCPSNHGYFLQEVLGMFDGPILVIDIPAQTVALQALEAVRNCAHLAALLDGGEPTALDASYEVAHHYSSYGALEVTDGVTRLADWMFLLGVDRPVAKVPALDRIPIVVKGPKMFTRTFKPAEWFSPIHDACVARCIPMRTLVGPERAALLAEVVAASRALRAGLGRVEGGPVALAEGTLQHPLWLAHWAD